MIYLLLMECDFMDDKVFELLEKLYSEFANFKQDISKKIDNVDNKVDKNTLLLEQVNEKIEILAEVQQNHLEINERQHDEMSKTSKEQMQLLKNALHHVINT